MIAQLPSTLLLLALSTHQTLAVTDCISKTSRPLTKPADTTQRISAGIDCTTTRNDCYLDAGGWLVLNATLNITTANADKIYDAFHESIDKDFNPTVKAWIGNSTMKINQGQKGYVGFTTDMRCYNATLGDCFGDDVEKGTVVEACAPSPLLNLRDRNGTIEFGGEVSFVQTDDIEGMESNPALVRPREGNAAGRLGFGGGTLGLVLFAAIFWHFL